MSDESTDWTKILAALTALIAAVGGLLVAFRGGGDDPAPSGITIVVHELGDYQRFLDQNPDYWRE